MAKQHTTVDLIRLFLDSKTANTGYATLGNHAFEKDVEEYAKYNFGIVHTPGTYGRTWRRIRATQNAVTSRYKIRELIRYPSKEKWFEISRA